MYRILRRYKVGNKIKYISFPITRETKLNDLVKHVALTNNKIECNFIRARSKIKDYVLCNDFKYFFTLTCNNKKVNRYDVDKFCDFVTRRIRYIRSKYKLNFKYILVPEKHKKGGYHLHGVFTADIGRFIRINNNGYDELSLFSDIGFNSIEEIINKDKLSSYITKYITKDFSEVAKGKHLYLCSRGLDKPIYIDDIIYNNNSFDFRFFEYRNDFSYIRYLDKNINFKTFL